MARNHSRLSRKGLLSTLVGIVAILAGAVTAAAATIPSPVRYVRQPGYAVERAADASERLLDLDVRGLAQLRAVPEKEAVTLQGFPFAPGATGDLVLERFDVASPEGRTLIEGAAGRLKFGPAAHPTKAERVSDKHRPRRGALPFIALSLRVVRTRRMHRSDAAVFSQL